MQGFVAHAMRERGSCEILSRSFSTGIFGGWNPRLVASRWGLWWHSSRRNPSVSHRLKLRLPTLLLVLLVLIFPWRRCPRAAPWARASHESSPAAQDGWKGAEGGPCGAAAVDLEDAQADVFVFEDPSEFASEEHELQQKRQEQQRKSLLMQKQQWEQEQRPGSIHLSLFPSGLEASQRDTQGLLRGRGALQKGIQSRNSEGQLEATTSSDSSLSGVAHGRLADHAAAAATASEKASHGRGPSALSIPTREQNERTQGSSEVQVVPNNALQSDNLQRSSLRLMLPPLPVSRWTGAPGLRRTIEDAYDSLCMYTEAAARSYMPEVSGRSTGASQLSPHSAVRPLYTEAQANDGECKLGGAGAACTSSKVDSAKDSPQMEQGQMLKDSQVQRGPLLVADAWRRVGARFLLVLPVVSVDGFLVSFSGVRIPALGSRPTDSRKIPFSTSYPGMAHLLFLVSLGPHITSRDGEPLPRMPARSPAKEGGLASSSIDRERREAMQHVARLSALVEKGSSLWPERPLLLTSRPSSLILLKSLFRSRAFTAQINELLTTASKEVLSFRCLQSSRQDCWAPGRRWSWGRRNSLPFLSTLFADSRAKEKAACVYAELLIRMHQGNRRSASISQRLRDALLPAFQVAVVGDTTTRLWNQDPLTDFEESQKEQLNDSPAKESEATRQSGSVAWGSQHSSVVGASVSSAPQAQYSEKPQSMTSFIISRLSPRFGIQRRSQLKGSRIPSSVNTETAYKFYVDPTLTEPIVLFGDDSASTLALHLGLSLVAPHKTAAMYIHVVGDVWTPGTDQEKPEYYLDAFKTTRFTTETGVQVPVHTLEFDVGVSGTIEDVLSLMASLTSAASHVSSSQLQAAAEEEGDATGEARRVRTVSMNAFKPLLLLGKALSHFIGAHLTVYRTCRGTSGVSGSSEAQSGSEGTPTHSHGGKDTQSKQKAFLDEAMQQISVDGAVGCHLPLIFLKPRFVVHKTSPQEEKGSGAGSKKLHVEVLPVLHGTGKDEASVRKYTGPRARFFAQEAMQQHAAKSTIAEGFPVILFRTPVHALTQSWLVGLVDRPDVFRGATKSVQDMRAFLPIFHPSRLPLYRDLHVDFLHMLAVVARPEELLPPSTQSAALLLHLTRLKEAPASAPGGAIGRSVHVDASECQRRLVPVQLESFSWQMESSKAPHPGLPLECLQRQQQNPEDDEEVLSSSCACSRQKTDSYHCSHLPLGATDPPWSLVRAVVGGVLQLASHDVIGHVEQAANDLGAFFCSSLPFLHFMESASATEIAEFTLGLAMRLHSLRKEVIATALSARQARGPTRRRGTTASGGEARGTRQPHQRVDGSLTQNNSIYTDNRYKAKATDRRFFEGEPSATSQEDSHTAGRQHPSTTGNNERSTETRGHALEIPRWYSTRWVSSLKSNYIRRGGPSKAPGKGALGSRAALEVVDVQLQMQHQLLEISSGLAVDIACHYEKRAPRPSPEKFLQVLPELQRQLDLEKDWAQNLARQAPTSVDDDSPFSYYLREVARRTAAGEVLQFTAKETADLALSLINAAEWIHSLKEEGRTPRAVFTATNLGGPQFAAGPGVSPALLHYYQPSDSWVWLLKGSQEEHEVGESTETLQDARNVAPQRSSGYMEVPLSLPSARNVAPPPVSQTSYDSQRKSGANSGGGSLVSSKQKERETSRKKGQEGSEKSEGSGEFSESSAHWWEADAASLLKRSREARGLSPSLVRHLHAALQSGPDWDCLGNSSVEGNALWLFVMGHICANSFLCEGFRTLLFGEGLALHEMLRVAKRGASGSGKAFTLNRLDAILEGRHQGFARSERRK
ncbi:uncharacterized protein LOC34618565 [Cyclospora cayetanensis]|uniref:Uncharacterized protein LOC34618565 n=1 Tax=Cyclospora cayetanensis TaxID=88456 RepID=A0A6P6RT87_9EIME|nr:uncharacterized protein LOC34618565 [Cyclospora cayetanensis]